MAEGSKVAERSERPNDDRARVRHSQAGIDVCYWIKDKMNPMDESNERSRLVGLLGRKSRMRSH
jgi:hypothetical protein